MGKKITDKDVTDKVMEINKKNCSPSFQVTSRDRHQFIFRNKTNPPDVGKYRPTFQDKRTLEVDWSSINDSNTKEAQERKINLDFENNHVCHHIVNVIAHDFKMYSKGVAKRTTENIDDSPTKAKSQLTKHTPSPEKKAMASTTHPGRSNSISNRA